MRNTIVVLLIAYLSPLHAAELYFGQAHYRSSITFRADQLPEREWDWLSNILGIAQKQMHGMLSYGSHNLSRIHLDNWIVHRKKDLAMVGAPRDFTSLRVAEYLPGDEELQLTFIASGLIFSSSLQLAVPFSSDSIRLQLGEPGNLLKEWNLSGSFVVPEDGALAIVDNLTLADLASQEHASPNVPVRLILEGTYQIKTENHGKTWETIIEFPNLQRFLAFISMGSETPDCATALVSPGLPNL